MHFLPKLLPTQGLYCAAQAASNGFIHRFFDNVDALVIHIEQQDAAGHTMYVAQATYKTPENRKTANAAYVRNFFFDVDCGAEKFAQTPDKAYLTQADGAAAIKEFAKAMKLPLPTVINSGNGLYAHWLISEDIPADKWKVLATVLKGVAAAAGFKQDPSRTSDTSSVLRPAGSTNRKNGNARPVKILHLSEPIPLSTFTEKLEAAANKYKISAAPLALPSAFKGLNDEFTSGVEGPPSSLYLVAERCAQVRKVRDTQGNVDEPTWYNFLGMARYTAEGREGRDLLDGGIMHAWSRGHSDYDHQITEAKIRQHELGGFGPTTCTKFATDNPEGCTACPHANSIKSPIVLGRPDPVSITAPEDLDIAPKGFRRGEDGLFWEDDGRWQRFYPYDLYIESIAYDFTLSFEVAVIKHQMPMSDDYHTFSVRSSFLHDPKQLLMAFADNHVQTTGDSRKHMVTYVDHSLAQLRAKRKLSELHSQMGWHETGGSKTFVLGEQIFAIDGEPTTVGFAKNVPEAGRAFTAKGDLDEWRATTRLLGLPGMEPFAFAFLAGAFGAPLIKFTGFAGAMVALIGDSGIGKTLLGEWIMSVYGDSQKLILLKDDTRNFLVQRLGLYGSLPIYIDEISNIEGQELSDLVYKITQGRDKGRLSRSGTERANINSWNTIAVASSNHSLTDKLSALKADASAEMNRILELDANVVAGFDRETSTDTYHNFRENYGLAGPVYIDYITKNQDSNRDKIDVIVRSLDLATDARADERFWSAVAGCAIYGGLVASKLRLIDFQVAPILKWVKDHIIRARSNKTEQISVYTDLLGQFLDQYSSGALITTNNGSPRELVGIIREPRAPLVYRIDEDTQRLYISRVALKTHLNKNFGSYTKLRDELDKVGALINSNKRKVLGGGTYFGGAQQPVWEIDLTCIELGRKTLGLVKDLKQAGKVVGL